MVKQRKKVVRKKQVYKPMLHHLELKNAIPASIRKHKLVHTHDVINHYAKLHNHPHSWMLHKEVMRQMGGGKPNAHYGFQKLVEPHQRHKLAAEGFKRFKTPLDVVHHLMEKPGSGFMDMFKKIGSVVVSGAKKIGSGLKTAWNWGKKAVSGGISKLGGVSSAIQKGSEVASNTLGMLGQLELIPQDIAEKGSLITGAMAEGFKKKVDVVQGHLEKGLAKAEKFEDKLHKGKQVLKQGYNDLKGKGISIGGSGISIGGSGLVLRGSGLTL